ncbi:unnamed protein product [Ophioblennius macclurei]
MAGFFSGAVTSSPVKRRLRSNRFQSPDESVLSPDSSYICYPSSHGGQPCNCRRSGRLLTNGYYNVTQDSFSCDSEGNVSLSPCKAKVSYKENPVRVFRRRRRPRRNYLAGLLSNVSESCQSWLDEKVIRGIFGTEQNQDLSPEQDWDRDLDLNLGLNRDVCWTRTTKECLTALEETSWTKLNSTELDHSFTFDPIEIPPPPDKIAPRPKLLIQEDIYSETCQSKDVFTQTLGGLAEVPPLSPFYTNTCSCKASSAPTGVTMRNLLLFVFAIFLVTALYSRCLWWSASVASIVFMMITTVMVLTKSGPMGEWRKAKTEDITSRNE